MNGRSQDARDIRVFPQRLSKTTKKGVPSGGRLFVSFVPEQTSVSLTDAELFLGDDSTVAVDVLAYQIVEERTALAYKHLEGACGSIVLVVLLKVLGEVLDAHGEKCDLAFGATGVVLALAIFFEDGLLLFCRKMHNLMRVLKIYYSNTFLKKATASGLSPAPAFREKRCKVNDFPPIYQIISVRKSLGSHD